MHMQTKDFYFNGKLSLSDSQDKMDYIITDLVDHEEKSITKILDEVYASKDKLVRATIRIYDNGHSVYGMGQLFISRDRFHTEGYHIGSLPFELQLFELVGKNIELGLEWFTTVNDEVQVHVS